MRVRVGAFMDVAHAACVPPSNHSNTLKPGLSHGQCESELNPNYVHTIIYMVVQYVALRMNG